MKTKKLLPVLISVFAALAIMIISCEKNDTGSISDEELQISEDDALVTTIFNDAYNDVEDELSRLQLKSTETFICKSVEHVWNNDTLIITITYNGECQVEFNGKLHWKSGKIIMKRFGGRYYEAGSTKILTFVDYYVDSAKIEGTKTIVSEGYNADSLSITFNINLEGGKLTFPDGMYLTRDAQKTRVMHFKENKVVDHYLVNGSANGINIFGDEYSRTLTDLWIKPGCPFIMSGNVLIEIEGKSPINIDYGNETCDAFATVTRNGESKDIELRLRWRRRLRIFR